MRQDEGEPALVRCEFRIGRPDGRRVWVDLTTSLVEEEDGRPVYRLSQIVDIDARKRAAEQPQHLADHDALSGGSTGAASSRSSNASSATPPPGAAAAPCS